jgi:hypothetical protein
VNWRAAHEGPDRFFSRSEHETWDHAHQWLLKMMTLTAPPNDGEAFWGLVGATPDCSCLFQVGGHHYALSDCAELMEACHAA